ncbi:MAG: hypothetical protein CM15mP22_6430 [Gammaproteobacteria bacterium]|nr:MAG: hypothetical protein CM15mP22_6430 [Gammaproteobacteria bacterium]
MSGESSMNKILRKNLIYVVNKFHHESHLKKGKGAWDLLLPTVREQWGKYLGASEMLEFSMDFMDELISKNLFTEGYQFSSDQNFKAFLSVLKIQTQKFQLALNLLDPFVVSNFKNRFENVFSKREFLIMFSVIKKGNHQKAGGKFC